MKLNLTIYILDTIFDTKVDANFNDDANFNSAKENN